MIIPRNIGTGDQLKPEFLAISPSNRIPAIVDHEPEETAYTIDVFMTKRSKIDAQLRRVEKDLVRPVSRLNPR